MTLFDDVGGEDAVRRIVDRFVDKLFDDPMIGFFFRSARKERIKEKEYEFAARHLGANVPYTGRPLRDAHAPHPIMGGQFNRRLQILKDTFEELGVPEHVRAHWIDNTEKLRSQITRNPGNLCDPTLAGPDGKGGASR
ncbi:MAG TPA: group 1 truncated hemoglobin [Polyangiaceae bacterium]|jgi:hemoglobin|nr:group 1 truncated hemoglobin [Polyangiaceae bacterium]